MKAILKTLALFLLLVLSSGIVVNSAYAQTACPTGRICTVFIWVNGIAVNSSTDWSTTVNDIRTKFFANNPSLDPTYVKFDTAYNQSFGRLTDIFGQSIFQWDNQFLESFLANSSALQNSTLNNIILAYAIKGYTFNANRFTTDLITIGDKIHSWENLGYRVILVGHSQGSFLTNEAYRVRVMEAVADHSVILPDTNLLSVVNIASPASSVADGRNMYTTQCNDIITIVPGSLPGNVNGTSVPCTPFLMPPPPTDILSATLSLIALSIDTAKLWYGTNIHLLPAYMADGSATQQQIFAQMFSSISTTMTTTTTLGPINSDDVWVTSTYYGGGLDNEELRVGGWGDTYYALLKFNSSNMPYSVSKAELRLYEYPVTGSRASIYLDRVTSPWTESTKWSNKPTSVNLSTLPTPVDNQWYSIDITNLYNGWQNGSYPNYGIMLRPTSVNNIFSYFHSSEYSTDTSLKPQLVLTYTSATPPVNTAPTLTLSGANPLSLNVGTQFVEPGFSATDAQDGNISANVTVSGSVNINVVGTYTLTYSVTDSGNLSVSKTRTVTVVALPGTTTTTYSLTSSQCNVVWITNVYYGGGMHDADMRVGGWGDLYYSLFKCSLTGMPISATMVKLRLYEYPVTGSRGQMYFDRITSNWDNSTKWANMPSMTNISTLPTPVDNQWYEIDITSLYNSWQSGTLANYGIMLRPLSNSNVFNYFRSTEYTDQNYRPQIVVTSITGANTPPVITLSGSNPLSLNVGNTFVEPGYTATDTEDGNITSRVTVSGSVNTSVAGTYTLTYNVTDLGGMSASPVTRTVIVSVPAPQPLSGSCAVNGSVSSITLQTGNTAYYGAGTNGGTSPFHFLWTGATGGDSSSASQVYNTAGIYTASVRITDSGSPQQQVTATCPQVNVTTQVVAPFASSCYITPSSIRLGSSATYVANASGGYPPYQFYLPGTLAYQSPFNQGMTIVPTSLGVQSYSGIVQDSHGQVLFPACSVTVTN